MGGAPGARVAASGGRGIALGGRALRGAAGAASSAYTMPSGQATSAALAAQQMCYDACGVVTRAMTCYD
eukprot:3509359-Rhodomonas_salina.1